MSQQRVSWRSPDVATTHHSSVSVVTATLTPAETDYLLQMLQRLARGGLAIVYISHRLEELRRIADRCDVVLEVLDRHAVTLSLLTPTTLKLMRQVPDALSRPLE